MSIDDDNLKSNAEHLQDVKPEFVEVAVPLPLRRCYDYILPETPKNIEVGARIKVPFGSRNQVGVIRAIKYDCEYSRDKLKTADQVLDDEAIFEPQLLATLNWISQYYLAPIGEVYSAALPGLLRKGKELKPKTEKVWQLSEHGRCADIDSLSRAPLQLAIIKRLVKETRLSAVDFKAQSSGWRQAVSALEKKGWLDYQEQQPELKIVGLNVDNENYHALQEELLNDQQQAAIEAIEESIQEGLFSCTLLHGVTGSGKTEVYFESIKRVVESGRQALLLVPEIGLTSQLINRINSYFKQPLAVLHSGLNDTERHLAWWHAREGSAKIILGTRSAVFTSFADLGLIIVDEEHDGSFKQQDGVRYHARDVAVYRAKQHDIPIVLGSATPSLETYANARSGRYQLSTLTQRATNTALPKVALINLNTTATEDGISSQMFEAIDACLAENKQVLLFLNRRGYAPVLFCADCRKTVSCHRCDSNLTVHRRANKVRCHHCGYECGVPNQCQHCFAENLADIGEGTQRVEETLERRFPGAKTLRIDRDSTSRKGALDDVLQRARRGEADILLGTQLLTKGHDFPEVALVGVLNADQGLYSTDFRAAENLFQQIIQVAGRAGRRQQIGRVLIQTAFPEHNFFEQICRHDFNAFADQLFAEREAAEFPPFGFFALLRAESNHQAKAMQFLRRAKQDIKLLDGVRVMDVIPAPMERRAGRYRAQLLVCSNQRSSLNACLANWLNFIEQDKQAKKLAASVRWNLDIDPQDLY
ncbi:MAG: primosomal protein N' [Acidiferrobacterales bacterium]|nr:primosomal protein N' [Acidiferrobacterales bacterium]